MMTIIWICFGFGSTESLDIMVIMIFGMLLSALYFFRLFELEWIAKKNTGPTTWRWSSGVPMQAHQALRATCLLEKNDPSKFEGLESRHQQLPASLSIT